MSETTKKPFYKKKRFIIPALLILLIILIPKGGSDTTPASTKATQSITAEAPAAKAPEFDAQAAYDKVQAGQTKADAEVAIGLTSDSCTESTTEGYGTTAFCSYRKGFSSSSLSVVYFNGKVQSKSIVKL